MRQNPATRGIVAVSIALVVGFAGVGCAESSAGPALGPPVVTTIAPVQTGSVRVSARDNDFILREITIAPGTEVVWKNDGRTDHNVIPSDATGEFRADTEQFGPKAEYRYTFTTPGIYRYFCSIHGTADRGMIGTVQVFAPNEWGVQL